MEVDTADAVDTADERFYPVDLVAVLRELGETAEPWKLRLFYVALTRASERVDIVHGYFGGKEFPPLAVA